MQEFLSAWENREDYVSAFLQLNEKMGDFLRPEFALTAASICWVVAETETQLTIFNLFALKKQLIIIKDLNEKCQSILRFDPTRCIENSTALPEFSKLLKLKSVMAIF